MLSKDEIESKAHFIQETRSSEPATRLERIGVWLNRITQTMLIGMHNLMASAPTHHHTYIACPKCDWRPQTTDNWSCSCSRRWNVFAEHGTCPTCGRMWSQVQCLKCNQWSDQDDWQHFDDDLTVDDVLAHPERIAANKHKAV